MRRKWWAFGLVSSLLWACEPVDSDAFLNLAQPDDGTTGQPAPQPVAVDDPCTWSAVRCEDAHANCGLISDTCGQLDCGVCPTGQTCGGGGTANLCGSRPVGETAGDVRWAHVTGCGAALLKGLATNGEGTIWVTGTTAQGALFQFTPEGELEWSTDDHRAGCSTHSMPSSYDGVSVSPVTGELYAWGYCNTMGPCGSISHRYAPDGRSCTVLSQGSDEAALGPTVFDALGNSLHYSSTSRTSEVRYQAANGATWTVRGEYDPVTRESGLQFEPDPLLDENGNAILVAYSPRDTAFEGTSIRAGSTVILVVDSAKRLRRHTELQGLKLDTTDSGLAADGSLVIAGAFTGTLEVPGQTEPLVLDRSQGMVKFNANGELAWARRLPSGALAVDDSGRIAVAGTHECGARIEQYSPDGELLWTRTVAPTTCENFNSVRPYDVAYAQGQVIVTGSFRGTVDFGDDAATCNDVAGFLINLGS